MVTQSDADKEAQAARTAKAGVLLVHGLNGSISDMVEIEELLRKNGLVTRNLLLPGHGSHVRDMLRQGWPEWAAAVRAAYRGLRHQCEHVLLVGHSLGGALCLHTAAHEEVAGVVSMCAPISMRFWMRPLIRAGKYLWPLVPTIREDVSDPAARLRYTRDVYRWTAMGPVESMMNYLPTLRTELPRVTAPALIMVANRDHVVSPRDGREIYQLIGSREKHFVTFHRSYHVIMKDHDREEVFAKTEAFILRHALHVRRDPF
ncbi:MAG TPA: alpha/beta fold hydrolase [Ktedonobacteraceae bacterium]